MLNQIILGDCLEVMKDIPDKSVDMILCDLPYGVTRNKWDSVINLQSLWMQYERITKDSGAIVLTAQDKFAAKLMLSNEKIHRYNMIWHKSKPTGFLNAKRMPLRDHEDILVFYKKLPTYNPQFFEGKPNHVTEDVLPKEYKDNNYGKYVPTMKIKTTKKYPRSVVRFNTVSPTSIEHPTQKPAALFEYLIKTYTNAGETVLDNCVGSGTTAIAAINTGRNFIGIEQDEQYHAIATKRVEESREARNAVAN